ncbi:MAG: serine/threonine protein kinase [Desulfovibrio sp.]|nr:serine/threonine protein kinase [Desulfovibrio sp.]
MPPGNPATICATITEDSVPTVKELIERHLPRSTLQNFGSVHTDTTEFMNIGHGDVICLGDRHYLVLRDEAERRFGMEDPKFWVKRCTELESGEKRILKLVFHERFDMKIGELTVPCYRSPEKEARILDLTRGDPRFMQGFSLPDSAGNTVRVIEVVFGKRLDLAVDAVPCDHETYFREHFPEILANYIEACEAIAFLHDQGERHGDIRRDHLFRHFDTGRYVWIDFDYTFEGSANPFGVDVFGLGNILLFLACKGIHTAQTLAETARGREILARITPEDYSVMYRYRIMNLEKIFPYLPRELSFVLQHYAVGSEVYYESARELLADLRPCLDRVARGR